MNQRLSGNTRRDFLKTSALALPLAAASWSASAAGTTATAPASATPRTYAFKKTRLSIAMWDFSWLLAHHPGGAYEDLERRVVEAAERGYNTLRVDCFPSRILDAESKFSKNWTPGVNLPRWGQTAMDHTCNVRQEVARLAELCRQHGLWLGLDSWDVPHMFHSAMPSLLAGVTFDPAILGGADITIPETDEEHAFTRYGETWAKALKLMREDGVLERAVWIAPMNEVPHFCTRGVASITALRKVALNEGETKLEQAQREDAIYRRLNHWMAAPIRAEVAREAIPISYSSLGAEHYAARLTDDYDVVDIHFMPGVGTDKADNAAFAKAAHGVTGPVRFAEFEKFDLKAYSLAWDRACQKHYNGMLRSVYNYHHNALNTLVLPSGKQLTAIITECFGPCFWPDHPDVDWQWYQRYNADALRVVASMNFAGSSLSNYGEPLFTLWNDADWHWTSNTYFQALGKMPVTVS